MLSDRAQKEAGEKNKTIKEMKPNSTYKISKSWRCNIQHGDSS